MAKLKYKIARTTSKIWSKNFGTITNANLTNEIAESLLQTGAFNGIILEVENDIEDATIITDDLEIPAVSKNTKKKNGFKKSNSKIN